MTGCFSGAATLPLTLHVDGETAMGEVITLTLNNPMGHNLFLPAVWNGIAIYRRLPSGQWAEYSHPDGFQPMLSTAESKFSYTIPAGFLDPGSYKLVLQGRKGSEGKPFTLETNLEVG